MQPSGLRTKGRQVILISLVRSDKNEKGSSISARALNMAGVERFELPTRGFGIRCSANWSYTPVETTVYHIVDSKKPRKSEVFEISGGADGTRTRDPRRDRPVF